MTAQKPYVKSVMLLAGVINIPVLSARYNERVEQQKITTYSMSVDNDQDDGSNFQHDNDHQQQTVLHTCITVHIHSAP